MLESLVLGTVQGVTEWLPVSSQGAVTAVGSFLFDMTLSDAVSFALWLHLGTALAAAIAFRRSILELIRQMLSDPFHPSPLLRFAVVGTSISVAVGVPVILALDDLSDVFGAGAMLLVGVAMLCTAIVLRANPIGGTRHRNDLSMLDALAFGFVQGLAAIPGLSRSGLTISLLLGRRVERAEALTVSFLMSIPASLGAALFAGFADEGIGIIKGLVGAMVSAGIGLVSIKTLLALVHRVDFVAFVSIAGVAVAVGGVAQVVV